MQSWTWNYAWCIWFLWSKITYISAGISVISSWMPLPKLALTRCTFLLMIVANTESPLDRQSNRVPERFLYSASALGVEPRPQVERHDLIKPWYLYSYTPCNHEIGSIKISCRRPEVIRDLDAGTAVRMVSFSESDMHSYVCIILLLLLEAIVLSYPDSWELRERVNYEASRARISGETFGHLMNWTFSSCVPPFTFLLIRSA